jgi:hypothetical protein
MLFEPESKLFLASSRNQAVFFPSFQITVMLLRVVEKVHCVPQKVPSSLITDLNAVHQCACHARQYRCTEALLKNIDASYRN